MSNPLLQYLSRYVSLNEEETQAILQFVPIRTFDKGTVLLKEGDIAHECYFILKGCIRKFSLIDGVEKTTEFYTEEQSVTDFISYAQKTPVRHYLSCLEETTVAIGRYEVEMDVYEKYPKFQAMANMFMGQDLGKMQEAYAEFITSTPEERYLKLMKNRPELLTRVPQHQLASYLGITPVSLSRIRKRISSPEHR